MGKRSKETENLSSDSDNDDSGDELTPIVAAPPKKWSPSQLFVSGLPYETTEEQLKEFFGDCAKDITNIKLPKYQDTGRCLGYAHVLISTQESYDAGLKLNREKLGTRYLDIKPAEGAKVLNQSQTSKFRVNNNGVYR